MTARPGSTDSLNLGRAHRKQMRRTDHSACPTAHRRIDALTLLERSMKGRVADLIALKYQRMAISPFAFFRGAVPIMAYDLSLTPNTGLHTQLCGDAHVHNLGAYAAPDGRIVFDINDFDETTQGPFEWDLKRMATSILLAGREGGTKNAATEEAALTFVARYRLTMHAFTRMPVLDVSRYQVHRSCAMASIEPILRLAERASPQHSLDVLTQAATPARAATSQLASPAAAGRIFRSESPKLRRVTGSEAQEVLDSLATYRETLLPERKHLLSQYRPVDVAFKVVGIGSVGLRDYCVYLQGNGPGDPLFLQIKQEPDSAYLPYLGQSPTQHHQGRRVAEGQRAMQLQSDPFLGWTTIAGRDYVVRQLNDHKASVDLGTLRSRGLIEYANLCGELLARGHARAGACGVLAGYIGTSDRFDKAILRFAASYAAQTNRDWNTLVKWLKTRSPGTTRRHTKQARQPLRR